MRPLAGICAVLAFALAGCGGSTGAGAGGADIVPGNATMFLALNSNPDSAQWRTVDQLANRFPDKVKAVDTLKKGLRDVGLDWQNDVKPALGPEFDFVWLDLANNGQNFVVITQPKDKSKFDKLVIEARKDSPDLFRAKTGDWEILGPSQESVDAFRRASESNGAKLADNAGFREAMSSYPDDALIRAYLSGPSIMEVARRDLAPSDQKFLDKAGKLDWIASDLRATPNGVRMDLNVHGKVGAELKGIAPAHAFSPSLQQKVPGDALFYASFHGAKGMLTGLEHSPILSGSPELRRYSGLLRQVESLLQGENAVYVRPGQGGGLPEVTLVTEPASGTNGAATLDRILQRYRSQLQLPRLPQTVRIAGTTARKLGTGSVVDLYYANVGKRFVVTNLPGGIKALAGNPSSLAQSDDYKGALAESGMPAKTQGFLYVNVTGGISYAQKLGGVPIPDAVMRNVKPLRSAVTYAATRPSELQITFFLRIK
jgi:hypothetical protein